MLTRKVMKMIGAEVILLGKTLLQQPGVGHLAVITGLGVASATTKHHLLKRGHEMASATCDRIFYLAGGLVFLDVFMTILKSTAAIFGVL
jgi:hypothetical protein